MFLPCWGSWRGGGRQQKGCRRWGDCLGYPRPGSWYNHQQKQDSQYQPGLEPDQKKIRPTMGGKAFWKEFQRAAPLKKPMKYWLGTVALHEIWSYQKSTEILICKCPFVRVVCKIVQDLGQHDLYFDVCMVMALQEAVEFSFTSLLKDMNLCTIHATCITFMPKDIQLVHHICREHLHF